MKTYLINSIKQLSKTSQKLDLKSSLMSHEWVILTENSEDAEKFLFLEKDELFISIKGKSSSAKWRFFTVNSSVSIEDKNDRFLFKIVFCDKNLLFLNLDGTQQYCFLIDSKSQLLDDCSLKKIQLYLIHNCNIDILTDEQREKYKKEIIRKRQELYEFESPKEQQSKTIVKCGLIIIIILIVLFFFLIDALL